jgi:membrane-bound lytic murein transglycosylase MltF
MAAMMSADDYRAKAAQLLAEADVSSDYETLLQREAMAIEWRRLAALAAWQEAMQAALKAHAAESAPEAGDAPLSTPPKA